MDIQPQLLALHKGHKLFVSSDKIYRVYRHTGSTSVLMYTAKEVALFDEEFHQHCVLLESVEDDEEPYWEVYLSRHGRMHYMNALYDGETEELILCMYSLTETERKKPYAGHEFDKIKQVLIRYIAELPSFRLRMVTGCTKIVDVMHRKTYVYEGE